MPSKYPPDAPRVRAAEVESDLRRRLLAAQPAAEMVMMHLAGGAVAQAHRAVDYGAECVAAAVLGAADQRAHSGLHELTRPGGAADREVGYVTRSLGEITVRDFLQRSPAELLDISGFSHVMYANLLAAAARYLAGVI